MDTLTWIMIGMIVVLGLTIYIGFAATLGAGEYEVAWGKEWVWIFYIVSLFFYAVSAGAAIGFGAYGIASVTMALSLFSDYIIGWAVGDDVVMEFGGNKPFIGIKYTAFVSKTIMLPLLAYLAGVGGSGEKYFGKDTAFGKRAYRSSGTSYSDFRKTRGAFGKKTGRDDSGNPLPDV